LVDARTPAFDKVEALCQHHEIHQFSTAADPEYTEWLDVLLDRASRGYGDRVLVAAKGHAVCGYVASIDTVLIEPDELEGLYFFVSAVAVSDEVRGSSVFTALTSAALETIDHIEMSRGLTYRGVLAQPGPNRALQLALRSLDFHPVAGTEYWAKVRAR
jgi:ribosomal protein S18 acetylase RimI-like enzyme